MTPDYPQPVIDFWQSRFPRENIQYDDGGFSVIVNPDLSDKLRVMVLRMPDGSATAAVTPEVLAGLHLSGPSVPEEMFRNALASAGILLHSPDLYFHFPISALNDLLEEPDPPQVRQLSSADEATFTRFQSNAPGPDKDEAFVELDHWMVFGAFANGDLVSATSMYPWDGSRLADLGVLTLPAFRGRGYGRDVVRAISRQARRLGYETQYRCQRENEASARLAIASGLTLFGQWEVIVQPES
ncbi:RimJ/RimL family protein N-acetyltransferase [Arthrobacter pigmenti]|uniref:RimJ/RimL family protein N-acetyltransferase n=1 Tax=Arthrobacter pigmenti TaxID=271432 RepID=A0A846RHD0_9MICC|nr:GNAT family N-acetyltransferase [Arthrobacter pigmenti]NJC21100.1 RimJ/RimL family protein N-acetyltransferase [Arthrobacter pigmenti]